MAQNKRIVKRKELIKKLKPYWSQLEKLTGDYHAKVYRLEHKMRKKIGIRGLEFFWRDGYCGIHNIERTMKLIHDTELGDGTE